MQSLSVTEARANFQEIIDRVHYTKESLVLFKRNKPWVILVPLPSDDETISAAMDKQDSSETKAKTKKKKSK